MYFRVGRSCVAGRKLSFSFSRENYSKNEPCLFYSLSISNIVGTSYLKKMTKL